MSPAQRAIFFMGVLAATALAATVAGILLHRAFPDHPWVTIIGPLGAAGTIIGLTGILRRR